MASSRGNYRKSRAREKASSASRNITLSAEALRAQTDFGFFCEWVTRNSPEPSKPAQHHIEWHQQLITGEDSKCLIAIAGKNIDLLAPRGSAKSSVLGLFAAWAIGMHTMNKKRLQILYISYSLNAARAKSATIKAIIESEEYQGVFPYVQKGDRWADDYWAIDYRAAGIKSSGTEEFTMVCAGSSGSVTSKRCFVAGTIIKTDIGNIPVEELQHNVGKINILSLNHDTNQLEYRKLQGFASRFTDELIEITTTGGRSLRCTPNHPIYIFEQGYRETGSLVQGQTIVVTAERKRKRKELSWLQQPVGEKNIQQDLQGLLSQSEKDRVSGQMRLLSQYIFSKTTSVKRKVKNELREFLLQLGMFQGLQVKTHEEAKVMPGLWCGYIRDSIRNISQTLSRLLGQGKKNQCTRTSCLSSMQYKVSSCASQKNLLFSCLCKQCTLNKDDGEKQQPSQEWSKLQQAIGRIATANIRKRFEVLPLWSNRNNKRESKQKANLPTVKSCSASYQRNTHGQSTRKFNNALQSVSHSSPCITETWQTDTISSVRKLCSIKEQVYDIQVEGNHNLFANQILSHNCSLILYDDPIKSSDQIATENVREKMTRNWSTVIRPTLLEGGRVICLGTRFRPDDIHTTTFTTEKGWTQIEQRAIYECNGVEYSYWESMWSLKYLQQLRQDDPTAFSFQYQNIIQRINDLGINPDWINYTDLPDYFDAYYLGMDLASSLKQKADYTVMMLLGKKDNQYYFIDYRRGKWMGNIEKCDALLQLWEEWGEEGVPFTVFVESVSYQASFKGDFTEYVINQKGINDITCVPSIMKGDKLAHLMSVSGIYANGIVKYNRYVFHPESPPVKEMTDFGSTPRDDCMDASVLALQGAGARRKLIGV